MSLRSSISRAVVTVRRSRYLAFALVMFGGAFLLLDALWLPVESTVGGLVQPGSNPRATLLHGFHNVFVTNSHGELRLAPRFPDADTPLVAWVNCSSAPRPSGWWAITREEYDATVTMTADHPLSLEMQDRIRILLADYLAEHTDVRRDYVKWVRESRGKVNLVVWIGYVHNSLTAMLAATLLAILALATVRFRDGYRSWSAVRVGRCPSCGYDLRGNRWGGCPECGWRRNPASSP